MAGEEATGRGNGRKLDDVVREADAYYNYLRKKDVNQTRLDVAVVTLVVWISAFVVLGFTSLALAGCLSPSAFSACVGGSSPSQLFFQYLLFSAAGCTAASIVAGITTYVVRRRRRSKFEEVGTLLNKMRREGASSEDGIHLMDAMHQAALVVKKRKVDSAFEYGVIAFILVGLFGMNVLAGIVVGALAYLYFREKALRDYDKEDKRYEDSKVTLLQSL